MSVLSGLSASQRTDAAPYHPIIYVRGYAMTEGARESTVHTPYMGFNLGSTRVRQQYDGSFKHYIFESPLIRLMKEYGYQDAYADGINLAEPVHENDNIPSELRIPRRSIIIHRYYESALSAHQGASEQASIESAAQRLSALIARVKVLVCGSDAHLSKSFKVHLVAHSMGGLICRCLLQNNRADPENAAPLIDKVFTYGTPHNGIEVFGLNIPRFMGLMDANNFNRKQMASYLQLEPKAGRVNSLNGAFPPQRFFCFVGTNPGDYNLTRLVVEKASDGLVTIDNAYVEGAPRAHSYTSHSGPYGMVNSKEGYDNLVRFLFGDYRLKVSLHPEILPLSPPLRKAYDEGKQVRGSYLFDCSIKVRGEDPVAISKRSIAHHSAIFRSFDELLRPHKVGRKTPRYPVLASVFLDSKRIEVGKTMVLSLDLNIEGTDFRINGNSILPRRAPDERLYRQSLTLKVTLSHSRWRIRYIFSDQNWSDGRGREAKTDPQGVYIPLTNAKGFKAKLYLDFASWE